VAGTITSASDTQIVATSPAGMEVVDVTVTTGAGTSVTSPADKFSYGPVVTGISPSSGAPGGGTAVTITGTGFADATAVDFGTVAGTITRGSDTQSVATSPAGKGE